MCKGQPAFVGRRLVCAGCQLFHTAEIEEGEKKEKAGQWLTRTNGIRWKSTQQGEPDHSNAVKGHM